VSFKRGDVERMKGGRLFNDLNETLLAAVLAEHPELELERTWVTDDVRSGRRADQKWLNALVRRCLNDTIRERS
jgi:hypothetical protein